MTDAPGANHNSFAAERLQAIVDRYERLDTEKQAIADDQKDLMTEAKSAGFDTKALRKVLALRKLAPDVLQEQDALIDLYRRSLGMGPA